MNSIQSVEFELGEIVWHEFSNAQALSLDLANELIERFQRYQRPWHQTGRLAAFSGGSTPKPLFEALSSSKISIGRTALLTLVDERWVEPTHELSNHRFITATLLVSLG